MSKVEILVVDGVIDAAIQASLAEFFAIHLISAERPFPVGIASKIRGFARSNGYPVDARFIAALPQLEIIANLGVGYDGIDLKAAAARGIVITNAEGALTEEVADVALGLLLMTVRELSAAERHLRAGKWPEGRYRLSQSTMRDRSVGIVGLGRIGGAIARRIDAMGVPVVYHNRHRRHDVPYRCYPDLVAMAEDVDTLIVALPGGAGTNGMIDAAIFKALGPRGIFINIGRGSVVDEPALIAALRDNVILSAGLDVFAHEPNVSAELMALPNAVLLPHVGGAAAYTRKAMGQLLIDNLVSWFEQGRPLTPIAETPWRGTPA